MKPLFVLMLVAATLTGGFGSDRLLAQTECPPGPNGMEFVLIPAGTFRMGSEKGDGDEKPVHEVTISKPFCLGKFEVTQGQWKAVMGENPSWFSESGVGKECGDDCPVENVSWDDVQEFIGRLNRRDRTNAYRFPTEAEWEHACRAGTTTEFSWGDDVGLLGEYAWWSDNSGDTTHPVGRKKPNPWGLYDMHGNVWEWVQDWYGEYPVGPVTDPQGPSSLRAQYRVLRGGSWYSKIDSFTVSFRSAAPIPIPRPLRSIGFRCARTL